MNPEPINYIWSDTHFGHENVNAMGGRPFKTTEEGDKALLKAWRETVKKNDVLWNLGDFTWKWPFEKVQNLLKNLPGKKILVKGNHDKHPADWYRRAGFHEVYDRPVLYKGRLLLSHEPLYVDPPFINVHGHTHQRSDYWGSENYVNVSVECTN